MNTVKPGFRVAKDKTKKQKQVQQEAADQAMQNIQQSLQLMQMMLMNMNKAVTALNADLNNTMTSVNDIEYRTKAMIKMKSFDEEVIDRVSTELKIEAYELASHEDDVKRGLIDVEVVGENSSIVITSATPDEAKDKGIMRAKLPISQSPSMQFKTDAMGKRVGETIETILDGVKHIVTILQIKEQPEVKAE